MDVLVWTDIETTGLDPRRDAILEIGLLATDWDLKPLLKPWSVVLKPSMWRWRRHRMGEYARHMHMRNHLLDEVDGGEDEWGFYAAWLYLRDCLDIGPVTLAGSSVHFDRSFLNAQAYLPGFMSELNMLDGVSHRLLDVSALDETARHTRPGVYDARPGKTTDHRVMHCIHDSMTLYRYYLDHLISTGDQTLPARVPADGHDVREEE